MSDRTPLMRKPSSKTRARAKLNAAIRATREAQELATIAARASVPGLIWASIERHYAEAIRELEAKRDRL